MIPNLVMSADRPVSEPRAGPSESHPQLRRSASDDIHSAVKKRQKRMPGSQDDQPSATPSPNQTFYFVDSNSSSREKRAHVMRHHVQEKRRQRKHLHLRSDSENKADRSLRYLPWSKKTAELQEADVKGQRGVLVSPGRNSDLTSVSSTDSNAPILSPSVLSPRTPYTPSPVTMLSASRKDPFDSLPTTSPTDMELADYWTSKLTYWSGQNKHIKDTIFKRSMDHPLSFQATILTYCARWKAQLCNQPSTPEAEHHLHQATRSISEALTGRLDIDSDSLAISLAGMALQEDRFGCKTKARKYEDQAAQLLRSQPHSQRGTSTAEVFLHYVRYVTSPPPPPPPPPPPLQQQQQLQPQSSSSSTIPHREDGQQWLLTFLRAAEELMLAHSSQSYLETTPQRRTAFQMESPLFPLLSSGPRPSRVPEDSRIYVVRDVPTQEITRTAALIYITATLWDFQDSPSKTASFLTHLHNGVKQHELDRYPACETFIWLLLEENCCDPDLRDPERGWSTGELLKMHKQLRPDLQFKYNETLLSFLMLTPPIRGVDAFEKELFSLQGGGV